LLQDSTASRVSGKVGVSTMPRGPDGQATAALGGAQLAINAFSASPDSAYVLLAYLTAPDQMMERAHATGQFPARRALYDDPRLRAWLAISPESAREIIDHARARPVTPVYSELSEALQIQLHRALTGQASPADALRDAAREMRAVLRRAALVPGAAGGSSHS
jgi:trehalose/maltose transport system substrate-binding protein